MNLLDLKIIHIGNIAGNAYLNAKFQRKMGIQADVLVYDYRFAVGQPEWEDAYFKETEKFDVFNPDWNKIDLGNFKRPEWFKDIFIKQDGRVKKLIKIILKIVYLIIQRNKIKSEYKNTFFYLLKNTAEKKNFLKEIIKDFIIIYNYWWMAQKIKPLIRGYDIIQAYGLDPVIVMFADTKIPIVAFEHGTLRDLPFENTIKGKLLSLAYKKARKVIITNPDCVDAGEKLKLKNFFFIPHPLDENNFKPMKSRLRQELELKYDKDFIIFHPTRHNWEIKKNQEIIKAFSKFLQINPKSLLIFCDWGQDQKKSKKLIEELKIEKNIIWLPILSKKRLAEYYNASDIIADQFSPNIFGTTTPEALSCEKPSIINLEKDYALKTFKEMPPIAKAGNSEEIYDWLIKFYQNPFLRKKMGEEGRHWILKYHSSKVVTEKLIDVYKDILK